MGTRAATTLILLASLLGCADSVQENPSIESDRQAIEQLFEQYRTAFHDEDIEAIRPLYVDDAVAMPPGRTVISGRAAIMEEWYRGMFDAYEPGLDRSIAEIQVGGDWGFVRGTHEGRFVPAGGGEPMVFVGKYLNVVRRGADGRWRFARAMWDVRNR